MQWWHRNAECQLQQCDGLVMDRIRRFKLGWSEPGYDTNRYYDLLIDIERKRYRLQSRNYIYYNCNGEHRTYFNRRYEQRPDM
jgi:hypothetical protein